MKKTTKIFADEIIKNVQKAQKYFTIISYIFKNKYIRYRELKLF